MRSAVALQRTGPNGQQPVARGEQVRDGDPEAVPAKALGCRSASSRGSGTYCLVALNVGSLTVAADC